MVHQIVFNTLKTALTTAPLLGYPDFTNEFILETDALLKGLGAVLSQEDNTSKVHVIAYASRTLRPSKQSMCNYSSAKLELFASNWTVTEMFSDYKLGMSQMCWLSELALFNFNIQYHLGKIIKDADSLSQCLINVESEMEGDSNNDSEDPVMSSNATISNTIRTVLKDVKISYVEERSTGY